MLGAFFCFGGSRGNLFLFGYSKRSCRPHPGEEVITENVGDDTSSDSVSGTDSQPSPEIRRRYRRRATTTALRRVQSISPNRASRENSTSPLATRRHKSLTITGRQRSDSRSVSPPSKAGRSRSKRLRTL